MNSYKKKRIKKSLKKMWIWLLGTGIFLTIGIVVLLVGFNMTGWSIIDWLKSDYATTFFVLILVGALLVIPMVIMSRKVGDYDAR